MALKIALPPGTPDPMTRLQVAQAFRVRPDTVTRWLATGKLRSLRKADVEAALNGGDQR